MGDTSVCVRKKDIVELDNLAVKDEKSVLALFKAPVLCHLILAAAGFCHSCSRYIPVLFCFSVSLWFRTE